MYPVAVCVCSFYVATQITLDINATLKSSSPKVSYKVSTTLFYEIVKDMSTEIMIPFRV